MCLPTSSILSSGSHQGMGGSIANLYTTVPTFYVKYQCVCINAHLFQSHHNAFLDGECILGNKTTCFCFPDSKVMSQHTIKLYYIFKRKISAWETVLTWHCHKLTYLTAYIFKVT